MLPHALVIGQQCSDPDGEGRVDHGRVVGASAAAAQDPFRRLDPSSPRDQLRVTRDDGQPHSCGDGRTGEVSGHTAAVPPRVGRRQGRRDARGQPHSCTEPGRDLAVPAEAALATAGLGQRPREQTEPRAHRLAGPDNPDRHAQLLASRLHDGRRERRIDRQIIPAAEESGLGCVSGAAEETQQAGVVTDNPILVVQRQVIRQPHRHHAGAQRMLLRLPGGDVREQGDRRRHLGQPHPRHPISLAKRWGEHPIRRRGRRARLRA